VEICQHIMSPVVFSFRDPRQVKWSDTLFINVIWRFCKELC